MVVSSKLVFLKNSVFVLILVMLLTFSATIPMATATQEDEVEFEAPEIVDDQPVEPLKVQSDQLILSQVNSDISPQFVMPPEKVIPRLDLSRYVDGVPIEIPVPNHFPSASTAASNSRANEDLEITNMEFGVKNSGWNHSYDYSSYPGNQAYHGSFLVGSPTTITVTVKNNGPGTVNNVDVNFTIYDYTKLLWEGRFIPGMQVPTTKIITSINSGQTAQATYDWTPPFASEFAITAEVDWPTDPDTSNNFIGFLSRVAIWMDDIEGGVGSWTHSAGGGSVDDWHRTDTPSNPSKNTHTQSWTWYEGIDGTPDQYRDSNVCTLVSPALDLGNIKTRKTPQGNLYLDYLACYATLLTGEAEVNDDVNTNNVDFADCDMMWFREVSDDGGASWNEINIQYANSVGITGNRYTATVDGSLLYFTNPVWDTDWFPFPGYATTGPTGLQYNVGGIMNLNVTSWNNIKFRVRFDDDGDALTDVGLFLDDFIVWGVQEYYPDQLISIRNVTNPKQNGIPILSPNNQFTFSTDVKNYGKPGNFYVNISIKDAGTGAVLYSDSKQLNFQSNEEKTQNWAWTPTQEGNYDIIVTAGDEAVDWTPPDNREKRRVYVRNPTTNILVVDDDNSEHSGGIYRKDVEKRILDGLDAIQNTNLTYNVYNVARNETGPAKDIMDDYKVVIWLTGLDNQHDNHYQKRDYLNSLNDPDWDTALKQLDVTEIGNYLDFGGNLWLVSPGFLYDNYGKSETAIPSAHFPRQYLKISSCEANLTVISGGSITTRGTPNPLIGEINTLGDSASYPTYTTLPPLGFEDKGSRVKKEATETDALELFFQNTAQKEYNAVSYSGSTYKTVYFGFNFYLIGDNDDRTNLVERVMTFFGLLGGPSASVVGDDEIDVYPEEQFEFQFRVVNGATLPDSLTLTLEHSLSDWTPRLEIEGVETDQLDIQGKSSENDIYIYATVPTLVNAPADFVANFKLNVESKLTGFKQTLSVNATVICIGNVTMNADKYEDEIDVTESVDYTIALENVTNGDDTYRVTLTLSGDGEDLGYFSNFQNTIDVDLLANTPTTATLTVKADETEPAGFYNITVTVTAGTLELGNLVFTTKVNQFYDVLITTDDDTDYYLDPNDYFDEIALDVGFEVQNYGNGIDTVTMEATKDLSSSKKVESGWLEFDDETIEIAAYDPIDDEYGSETGILMITMPLDVDTGEYIIRLRALSEDPMAEDSMTITVNIVRPDLEIEKIVFKRPDGSAINPVSGTQKGFDVSIEVVIANLGDADVTGVDIELELSHIDESGNNVDDGTIVPTGSNSYDIISQENATVKFNWKPLEEATYTIKAIVDTDDDIFELDETNNELTASIKVLGAGKPDNGGGGDDRDGDGMPDWWEEMYGTNPDVHDAYEDPDGDELDNLYEYWNGTHPQYSDSEDLDGDGIPDGDGMPDGWEAGYGLKVLLDDADVDFDKDDYTNIQEYYNGTDPTDPNSYPGHPVVDTGGKGSEDEDLTWLLILVIIIIVIVVIIVVSMIMIKKKQREQALEEEAVAYEMQQPPPPGTYPPQQQDVLTPDVYPPPPQAAAPARGAPQQPYYPPQQPQPGQPAAYPPSQQMEGEVGGVGVAAPMPQAPAPQQLPAPATAQGQPQITAERLLPAPAQPQPQQPPQQPYTPPPEGTQ